MGSVLALILSACFVVGAIFVVADLVFSAFAKPNNEDWTD